MSSSGGSRPMFWRSPAWASLVTRRRPAVQSRQLADGRGFRYRNTRLPRRAHARCRGLVQKSDTENVEGNETAWGIRLSAPNNTGLRGELVSKRFTTTSIPALGFVNRRGIERTRQASDTRPGPRTDGSGNSPTARITSASKGLPAASRARAGTSSWSNWKPTPETGAVSPWKGNARYCSMRSKSSTASSSPRGIIGSICTRSRYRCK